MLFATIRHTATATGTGTCAAVVTDPRATDGRAIGAEEPVRVRLIPAVRDVGHLCAAGLIGRGARITDIERAGFTVTGETTVSRAQIAPVVGQPKKIFCCGLNYTSHIREMGHPLPDRPTLFAKFADTLTGPFDPITVAAHNAARLDFEGELAVVIGRAVGYNFRPSLRQAREAIAGFTIADDVSMRDYQKATPQWLAGKNLLHSTPLGPWLADGADHDTGSARLETRVNGTTMQQAQISDLLHGPAQLVQFISSFTALAPGDVIITGTTGGVGFARDPQIFLHHGDVVEVAVTGIGAISSTITVTD
ncbi:fumarylacetoacetate hydrolase family protein [Corynebacterium mendelii]|uniref:Fumarylacetoacetate hydrolase family protein n=1 Tax=Corynebacterium mendelii TaxID=2765362 RepID=A0A939IY15_9CORY|nr:fumarylacetoacetate hydrolase family protein [Corynebacterium mendelii]MBN9644212.1 fumarylacetoacetate hydrolase family protein [Corynebacterium mendelii]